MATVDPILRTAIDAYRVYHLRDVQAALAQSKAEPHYPRTKRRQIERMLHGLQAQDIKPGSAPPSGERKRKKRGQAHRSILREEIETFGAGDNDNAEYEVSYHATKGYRVVRRWGTA